MTVRKAAVDDEFDPADIAEVRVLVVRMRRNSGQDGLAIGDALNALFCETVGAPVPGGSGKYPYGVMTTFFAMVELPESTARLYMRVAEAYTPMLRRRIERTGVAVSFNVLREAVSSTSKHCTFEALVALAENCRERGTASLSRSAFRAACGLLPLGGIASTQEVLAAIDQDPQTRTRVLQQLATEPGQVAEFIDFLADEGGEEALDAAATALRRTRAEVRACEDRALGGADEETEQDELKALGDLVRYAKAFRRLLSRDPEELARLLPEDQLSAVNHMCEQAIRWNERLVAARGIRRIPA